MQKDCGCIDMAIFLFAIVLCHFYDVQCKFCLSKLVFHPIAPGNVARSSILGVGAVEMPARLPGQRFFDFPQECGCLVVYGYGQFPSVRTADIQDVFAKV